MQVLHRLERYYGSDRAAKVIYGAMLIFIFISGMEDGGIHKPAILALSTFAAALSIVVGEVYSEVIGQRIKTRGQLRKKEQVKIARDSLAIAGISVWPSLIFLLGAVHLYSEAAAYDLAMTYCLAVLLGFSYWANRISGSSRKRSLIFAVITLFLGIVVIELKYVFGH